MGNPVLTPGEVALLTDGLSDDVAFVSVLIHLGIRGNPPENPEPPSADDVGTAFAVLGGLMQRGLVKVGHMEYLDGGPPGRVAPVKHVEDPIELAKAAALGACASGLGWEWSCWVVNTPSGDDLARAQG